MEVDESDVLGLCVGCDGDAEMGTGGFVEVACVGVFAELKGSGDGFGVREGDVVKGED